MQNSSAGARRILVVEDEPSISELCLRVLADEGFGVDIAVNGLVAQDMLWRKDYDLLIIDIRVPVVDGKQLYQRIEDSFPKMANRVVFTTGDVVSSDVQHFLERAGRPVLAKPFTTDELKAKVGETLGQIEK